MDAAKEFTKSLLLDNAPGYVVERCLNNLQQESCKYIAGTVLTATIANLKHYVNLFSASEVVATLDDFMIGVDQTLLSTQIHKLTINGMFVFFSSDPNSRSLNQVRTISTSALMLMGFLERFIVKRPVPYVLRMKIGIATGPVLVGVLGSKLPKYTMVGEAADEAFVLNLKAREGTIRVSKVTYEMLKQCDCNFEMCVLQDDTKVNTHAIRPVSFLSNVALLSCVVYCTLSATVATSFQPYQTDPNGTVCNRQKIFAC